MLSCMLKIYFFSGGFINECVSFFRSNRVGTRYTRYWTQKFARGRGEKCSSNGGGASSSSSSSTVGSGNHKLRWKSGLPRGTRWAHACDFKNNDMVRNWGEGRSEYFQAILLLLAKIKAFRTVSKLLKVYNFVFVNIFVSGLLAADKEKCPTIKNIYFWRANSRMQGHHIYEKKLFINRETVVGKSTHFMHSYFPLQTIQGSRRIRGEDCASACKNTGGCTHFAHTQHRVRRNKIRIPHNIIIYHLGKWRGGS